MKVRAVLFACAVFLMVPVRIFGQTPQTVYRGKPTVKEYLHFNDLTTASYSVVLDRMSTSTAAALTQAFRESGVGPSTIINDVDGSVTIALGCFPTIMEAHIINRDLRTREIGRFLSLRRSSKCAYGEYDNPTSSSVKVPSFLEPNIDSFVEVSDIFGTSVTSQLELQKVLKQRVEQLGEPYIKGFEGLLNQTLKISGSNPLKGYAIKELATLEIANTGMLSTISKTAKEFLDGKIAMPERDYIRTLFIYADYFHEFEQNSVAAGAIYRQIYIGKFLGAVPTKGQRMRAIVELTALSRELVQKQVGSFHDAAYWLSVFKKEGFPSSSKAAAVINLMLIENFKSDNVALISVDTEVRSDFLKECNEFHQKFPFALRERVFMYNLQAGVYLSNSMYDQAYDIAKKTFKLYPLPEHDRPQWAGKCHPVISALILAVYKTALSANNVEIAEHLKNLLEQVDESTYAPILEPHRSFESF